MEAKAIPIPEDPFNALVQGAAASIRPVGWKVLLAMSETQKTTAGGVIKPDSLVDAEHTAQVVGLVVAMGDLCFSHPKFCGARLFEVGDWVTMRAYSGTRVKIAGFPDQEFRLINDDVPEAIAAEPTKVGRA
jgi:co-chaperonin GroES (HSP10)